MGKKGGTQIMKIKGKTSEDKVDRDAPTQKLKIKEIFDKDKKKEESENK